MDRVTDPVLIRESFTNKLSSLLNENFSIKSFKEYRTNHKGFFEIGDPKLKTSENYFLDFFCKLYTFPLSDGVLEEPLEVQ